MDSELAESVVAFKDVFGRRAIPATFGEASPETVERLKGTWGAPLRYRSFLLSTDPFDVETVTPVERVRLIPSSELASAQLTDEHGNALVQGWRRSWVVIGQSTVFGNPYFLDVGELDPEGDCPVFTTEAGSDSLKPVLCASTFRQFLRILAVTMEAAAEFDDDVDEDEFRGALEPRVGAIDPAALRAGHWT
ncbi:SMI1/KNR4 family protein [Actinosynnema sp. NPDC059797]